MARPARARPWITCNIRWSVGHPQARHLCRPRTRLSPSARPETRGTRHDRLPLLARNILTNLLLF